MLFRFWLFAINVPLGIVTFVFGFRFLPHTPRAPHMFDWQSAALSAVTFGFLIAAVDSLGHGEALVTCAIEFVVAIIAGVWLVYRQTHMASPLLPLDLLRIPVFALSVGTSVCSFCAQMLAFVSLPFLLQNNFGMSQVETGFLMTPWPLVIVFVAPMAGVLADRYSAGLLGEIGRAHV